LFVVSILIEDKMAMKVWEGGEGSKLRIEEKFGARETHGTLVE
jgi:hypothetical protein